MMKFKIIASLICTVIIAACFYSPPAGAEAKDEYVILGIVADPAGFSKGSLDSIVNSIVGALEKRSGVKFTYKQVSNEKEAYELLKKGEADFVLSGMDWCMAREAGVPVTPWAVLEMFGKHSYSECLYVRKDSPAQSVPELAGMSLIVPTYVDESLKAVLVDNGVDAPIKKFFGDVKIFVNPIAGLQLLLDGKVGIMMIGDTYMKFLLFDDKFKGQFRAVKCGPEVMPALLMRHTDIDKDFLEVLNQALVNAHHDPAFSEIRFVFLATQGKIVLVDETDYESNLKAHERAIESGWIPEIEDLQKNTPVIDKAD